MSLNLLGLVLFFVTIIIAAIAGMYLAFAVHRHIYKKKDEDTKHAGKSWALGYIMAVTLWAIMFNIVFLFPTELKLDHSFNIYAIEDSKTVAGSRFYIHQDSKYYYLASYKGGQKEYDVPASQSYAVEDANAKPHIEVFSKQPIKENWVSKHLYEVDSYDSEYKIVVPVKTLSTDFKLDLK
jgi:hypothetical protein